jgi:hypothetical protein
VTAVSSKSILKPLMSTSGSAAATPYVMAPRNRRSAGVGGDCETTCSTATRHRTGSSPTNSKTRASGPGRTGWRGYAAASGSGPCSPRNAA